VIWYKFNVKDYLADTLHLSDAEDLAYRRLIDLCYLSEQPLPLDAAAIARKIRLDLDVTESVLGEFFEKTPEGYQNARCEAEIVRYRKQVASNTQSGKKGGRPRKTTDSDTKSKPKGNPNKKSEVRSKTPSSQATRFDEFWAAWPASKRKVGRKAVEAKWVRQNLDAIADRIIGCVEALKGSEQWTSGFEPAPLTFVNQRRWEDEIVQQGPGRKVL